MKLLYIEWLKLKNHRFFWVGLGLYIICMLMLISLMGNFKLMEQQQGEAAITFQTLGEAGLYKLPFIWQNLTYLAAFFKFIPAFLLIFFISNEYHFKTYRQNVIDGLSITQFYLSKLFSAIAFSTISLITIFALASIMALQHNEGSTGMDFFNGSSYLIAFFAEVLFMCVFASFLTFLFRKSAVSIIVILAYYFIIEPILGLALGDPIKYFLPTAPSRELNLQPITRLMGADGLFGIESPDAVSTKYLLMTFFYTLLFAFGGLLILKKRDL